MIHVGDQPIELRQLEARILRGVLDRRAGQLELGIGRASVLVVGGLSDSDDDGLAMHGGDSCEPVEMRAWRARGA